MTDRSKQPAVMAKKIEQLEALLAAEKLVSTMTFDRYRDTLYELVNCQIKLKRVQEAME